MSLSSPLVKMVFPANNIELNVLIDKNVVGFDDGIVFSKGFRLECNNNILKIHSSHEFEQFENSQTRIVFISHEREPHRRTILGHMVVNNRGVTKFWCKPISFANGVVPDHYHQYTSVFLMVRFSEWFRVYTEIYRYGHMVNVNPIIFTPTRILVNRMLIHQFDVNRGLFILHRHGSEAMAEIYETYESSRLRESFIYFYSVGSGHGSK